MQRLVVSATDVSQYPQPVQGLCLSPAVTEVTKGSQRGPELVLGLAQIAVHAGRPTGQHLRDGSRPTGSRGGVRHQLLAALPSALPMKLVGQQRGRYCCPVVVAAAAVALHRLLEKAYRLCGASLLRVDPRDEGEGGGAVRAGRRVGGAQSEHGE